MPKVRPKGYPDLAQSQMTHRLVFILIRLQQGRRTTELNQQSIDDDDRRRTDAGAGVVSLMVLYPGTPCTEVTN